VEIRISKQRYLARLKKKARVRKKVSGTAARPRLAVFRSHKHIVAQVIDDTAGHTLVAASTMTPELKDALAGKKKSEKAAIVGEFLAKKCKEQGINAVVFDRGGFMFHGRVKALADGARKGGLEF
jgi:large subunit ribosomal protein L18